jgi:hypothetical protein
MNNDSNYGLLKNLENILSYVQNIDGPSAVTQSSISHKTPGKLFKSHQKKTFFPIYNFKFITIKLMNQMNKQLSDWR